MDQKNPIFDPTLPVKLYVFKVAVKEKAIFQQSAEEFRSQVERLSEENNELKLNSAQTEEILQNQR